MLIGWTFGEFSKSPLWYWLPKYCAWFSRAFAGAFCTIFSTRAMVLSDTPAILATSARVSIGANAFTEFCESKTPPCPQA